jgi:phage-related protein
MVDGSIIFDTALDTGGFEKGVQQLGKTNKAAANSVNETSRAIEAQVKKVERLRQKLLLAQDVYKEAEYRGFNTENAAIGVYNAKREVASATAELRAMQKAADGAASATGAIAPNAEEAAKSTKKIGKAAKESQKHVGGLERRIVGLARRVLVFSVITRALRSFREYLGKALKTSKEFTAAWNSLRGALLTAFQPIWETILPWLTKFINVLAKVITWVAAFFSWLTGKSLAASSKNAKSLYKEANAIEAVGKAADKSKLSLAAFDEINNLSSNKDTGSGGGSSGVTTPTFEVDTSYLEKVEGIMKKIGGWVLAIAAGLGAWKIASAFGADLKKCIGWFMTISGLVLGITGFLDAWNEGLNWDNLIQILTGAALFAGGLAVLFGKVGGAIGLIIDGIALIVIGIKEWVEQGELTDQAFVAIEAGIIAIGAALALLISPWALVVAAIAGVALAVYKYWDEISAFFQGVWEKISAFFVGIWEKVKEIFAPVVQWFDDNIITPLVEFFRGWAERTAAVFEGCWIIIQAVWKIVSEWFDQNVIQPVVAFFKKLGEDISRIFKEAWEVIKPIWNAVAGWFNQHVIQPIVKFFTAAWDKIKNAFVTAFEAISAFAKSIFNGVISMVEGIVNRVIKAINGIIGGFNKVVTWAAGVIGKDWGGVALLPEVHLPRLAEGTVVPANREFLAMLGDNKRETEIVSPLSTMKQALKEALKESGMGGNMNVQVFLDGQKVYDSVVDYSKRDIRRTGRYPILGE